MKAYPPHQIKSQKGQRSHANAYLADWKGKRSSQNERSINLLPTGCSDGGCNFEVNAWKSLTFRKSIRKKRCTYIVKQ